jgi:hypothetical protein
MTLSVYQTTWRSFEWNAVWSGCWSKCPWPDFRHHARNFLLSPRKLSVEIVFCPRFERRTPRTRGKSTSPSKVTAAVRCSLSVTCEVAHSCKEHLICVGLVKEKVLIRFLKAFEVLTLWLSKLHSRTQSQPHALMRCLVSVFTNLRKIVSVVYSV